MKVYIGDAFLTPGKRNFFGLTTLEIEPATSPVAIVQLLKEKIVTRPDNIGHLG